MSGIVRIVLIMASITLNLTLPDKIAREAEEKGLLTPQAIEALLRNAVDRQRGLEFLDLAGRARAAGVAPMTSGEIQAEIDAARAERRSADATGP